MAQIDHSEGDTVCPEEQIIVSLEADQQALELVNPRESALLSESLMIHFLVEKVLAS
jgi:hypothetical protein